MKVAVAGVVVVILLLVSFAIYSNRQTAESENGGGVMLDQVSGPASLRELMGAASDQMCSFTDEEGNSGTVYVSGGRMRGDFLVPTEEITGAHMVYGSGGMHMWFDGQEEGIVISLSDIERFSDFGEDGQQPVSLDKPADLECSPWVVDESKFSLPDIEFQDLGAYLSGFSSDADEPTKAMQCASCEALPEEARAQCEQYLGC